MLNQQSWEVAHMGTYYKVDDPRIDMELLNSGLADACYDQDGIWVQDGYMICNEVALMMLNDAFEDLEVEAISVPVFKRAA